MRPSRIAQEPEQTRPDEDRRRSARSGTHRTVRFVFALLCVAPLTGCYETPATDRTAALKLLNADRTARGLRPLGLNAVMNMKADEWAEHLLVTCSLSHSRLQDGVDALDWSRLAENVGYGPTLESVETAYMNSPGHRASILDPKWTGVGVGVARGKCSGRTRIVIVQEFVQLR